MNRIVFAINVLLTVALIVLSGILIVEKDVLGAMQSIIFLVAIELTAFILKTRLPPIVKLFLTMCAVYNAIGWMGNYYATVWYFDDIAHFVTAITVTSLMGQWYLLAGGGKHKDPWIDVLIIASMGIAVGTMWEICEWYAFQMLPIPPITIQDTISDLVNDSIGALIAGAGLMYNLLRIYNRNLTLRK